MCSCFEGSNKVGLQQCFQHSLDYIMQRKLLNFEMFYFIKHFLTKFVD